jgi:hypothetical protein
MHSSARGGADSTAALPPPTAGHHKGACCITDRQALLRSTGFARCTTLHATHVGRAAPLQIQATLDTHSHRPRLPGRPALLGTAASSLERQTAMALIASCSIRLRLRRQPPWLWLLPRVRAYAVYQYGRLRVRAYAVQQYGRLCGVAPTPPGRGWIQRELLPRTRSPPPLAHSDCVVRASRSRSLRHHLRPTPVRPVAAVPRGQQHGRAHHQPAGDTQQGTRWPAAAALQHRPTLQPPHPRPASTGRRQRAGRLSQPA